MKEKHKHGRRIPKVESADILLLIYGYLRDYNTFLKLGLCFGIDESNVYRWTVWAENVLNSYMLKDFDITRLNKNKRMLSRCNRMSYYLTNCTRIIKRILWKKEKA